MQIFPGQKRRLLRYNSTYDLLRTKAALRRRLRVFISGWTALVFLLTFPLAGAQARVFKKPEQAVREAFPGARIETKNLLLRPEQVKRVEKLARVKLASKMASFFVARKEAAVTGYAYVDTHTVRTLPEVVLYVLTPEGKIRFIEVVAFHEPLEYLPPQSWLKTFENKGLEGQLIRLKRDVPNISGSTLTARAVTDNARKVLALWKVLFDDQKP